MLNALIALDDLPRQNASQVKNKWGEVVRLVRQSGSVAVTNHSAVEMVLVDASTYRQLTEDVQALKDRERAVLQELEQRFDARLAVLQQPDAARKVTALFDTRGKLGRRPKAGASF
ncbi:prevent-host-death protein [Pseudorhodoferax sp. Leaf267]|nr:prevent-host-death protein [Pseudorhodoferax sp. Leaf267]